MSIVGDELLAEGCRREEEELILNSFKNHLLYASFPPVVVTSWHRVGDNGTMM